MKFAEFYSDIKSYFVAHPEEYREAIQLKNVWLEFWLEKRIEIPF